MTFDHVIAVLWLLFSFLVVGLIWYFRAQIKGISISGRVTKIGPIELSSEQTPSSPTETAVHHLSAANVTVASPELGKPTLQTGSAELQQFIALIAAQVSQDQLDPVIQFTRSGLLADKKITDPKELNEALLYWGAAYAVTLSHERNYRGVFGSQLQLLRQMETAVAGIDRSTATAIYEAAKIANPDLYRYFTFEHWLAFLQQSSLIEIASNGNYVLTPFGRGLLRYIQNTGLSLVKAF